ncbi:acyl-CoA dehydrogenase, partial [Streptomyces lunaelactis]|nr:acyl-CoA dehydrogenase [Streptomyces lunaelactis]
MDFRYTPDQADLKARSAAYARLLMQYEDQSEQAGGPLPVDTVRELT